MMRMKMTIHHQAETIARSNAALEEEVETMKKEAASQATELQSLRASVAVLTRREAFFEQQEAARIALTQQAAAERIALCKKEAADRKPIQLRDDALAEEEAQRLINNAYEGNVNRALISACTQGQNKHSCASRAAPRRGCA